MTTKPKPLHCWNGVLNGIKSICVCAHSRTDAARLISEAYGGDVGRLNRQIKDYFPPCWGNNMKDITPERGVWLIPFYGAQPSRVI